MDRKYIQQEHVLDRYLSGDLTVREAREFEQYCRDHPDVLKGMPIPVRLKARLARRPGADSETGVFQTIPSSATHVAMDVADEGFDADEERAGWGRWSSGGGGAARIVILGLAVALLGSLAGLVVYGMRASALTKELESVRREIRAMDVQAPASVQSHRVQLVRSRPEQPTLALGWTTPPQLLDLYIDVSQGKYTQFLVTIDRIDSGRLMQIRRVARDSNRELRLGLNSSAFGPGEYLFKIDGYTWRGQTQEIGWFRLDLR